MQIELHELELRYADMRVVASTRRSRLMASIAEHGQQAPVLVVRDETRHLVLIDGYGRVDALGELGRDVVEATVLDMPEAEALILAHRLESRRGRSAMEEGWLVAELVQRHGMPMRQVAARLRRSVSWVSRRLALVDVVPDVAQAAVKRGVIPAHAAAKYLAPLARANVSDCEQLVRALGDVAVTDRQVERLYRGYKCAGDAEARDRLLAQPHLFLRAEEASRPEPVAERDPVAPMLNDLDGIAGLAHRARRRVRDGLLKELDRSRLGRVEQATQRARHAFECLEETLTREARSCSTETAAPPS